MIFIIIIIIKNLSCLLIIYIWFMDIFSKLVLDQFLLYRPYDYKIILELDKKKFIYSLLYKINTKKLETTKQYLLENPDKGFINTS
jgi:hypothetical protein